MPSFVPTLPLSYFVVAYVVGLLYLLRLRLFVFTSSNVITPHFIKLFSRCTSPNLQWKVEG